MVFTNWEDAVKNSPFRTAVGKIRGKVLDRNGKPVDGEILMDGRTRSPLIVYRHTFQKIDTATPEQVDRCREWIAMR